MIGVGGLIGALLAMQYFYQGSLYLILMSVFLSIVIALARIKEKSHSYPQLYAGLFLGVFLESLIMILYWEITSIISIFLSKAASIL